MIALLFALVGCDGEDAKGEEGLVRTDLGTFTADADGFVDIPFEVGADSVSVGVYCGPYGYDVLAAADLLTDPSGATIFDDDDPQATAMRVGTMSDLLPLVIPVSPDLDVTDGTYTLGFYVESANASVPCQEVERVSAPEAPGTVDLDIVFVGVDDGTNGLNASSGEAILEDVLAEVGDTWAGALQIGEVTYTDFDGNVDDFAVLDDDEEFGQLLRNTQDRRSMTVFFVQEIRTGGSATILGLAGGPPGAAAVGGTSKSGMAVSTVDFADDPGSIARIIAHEGGHFLGLFHTSEKTGDEHDPLSDTPECTDAANGASACAGKGGENVMFWSGGVVDPEVTDEVSLSDDQAWVVQRSAAVQ